MAIIKLGAIASDVIGKVNGSVFQRSSAGLVMRTNPGVKRITAGDRTEALNGAALCQSEWQALTSAQRAMWDAFAIFRPRSTRKQSSVYMNGHAVFILENMIRYTLRDYGSIFSPVINQEPVLSAAPAPLTMNSVEIDGVAMLLHTNESINQTTETFVLYMSRPLLASQRSIYFKSRIIKAFATTGTEQNIGAYYESIYGQLPTPGQYIGYTLARYSNEVKSISAISKGLIQVI